MEQQQQQVLANREKKEASEAKTTIAHPRQEAQNEWSLQNLHHEQQSQKKQLDHWSTGLEAIESAAAKHELVS